MNLTELSDLLSSATDVLRVETLDAYSSPSDADYLERFRRGEPKPDAAEKQPWLDRLAAAAQRGHPWRRLRVVSRPVSEYTRYSAEFGYVDNVAAGEDVRVLDEDRAPGSVTLFRSRGDFYLVDGDVVEMNYAEDGAFLGAARRHDLMGARRYMVSMNWDDYASESFTDWWERNSDLHRDLSAV